MKKILFISLAVVLVLSLSLIGCTKEEPEEEGPPSDAVYIFAARPISGPLEAIGDYALGPVMDYWQDNVNRAGGINVGGDIGTIPIDLTIVDDTSEMGTMTSLLSGAIASKDYHYVLPPCSTSFLQAAAGICSAQKYVLLGAEGGATTIKNLLDTEEYAYLFASLTFSDWNQMPELVNILRGWQQRTTNAAPDPMDVYIMYIGDLHGFEYRDSFIAETDKYPGHFNIVAKSSVPLDAVSVLTQLQEADTLGVDLVCSFTYPPASFLTVAEAIANNINFNAMCVGPGLNFEFMMLPVVAGINHSLDLQGVMGFITFNEESLANLGGDAANFVADYSAFFSQDPGTTVYGTDREINGVSPVPMGRFIHDWWGEMPYVAMLEMLVESIEDTGSLTNEALRDELATRSESNPFTTTFGPAWFVNPETGGIPGNGGGLMCLDFFHGQIGQWQYDKDVTVIPGYPSMDGYPGWMIYEIIDEGNPQSTAAGIYPKPDWGDRSSL